MWPAAFLLPLLLAPDAEAVAVRLQWASSAESRPPVPVPQFPIRFRKEPAAAARALRLGPDARGAEVRLGGQAYAMVFDRPPGSPALGLLFPDASGKGEFPAAPVRGTARPAGDGAFVVRFDGFILGGIRATAHLHYREGRIESAVVVPADHRRGRATIGGAAREVLLLDGDGDGLFDGAADRWLAFRVDVASKVPPLRLPQTLLLSEPQVPFEPDGRALRVEKVAKDGSSLRLLLDAPRATLESVLARRDAEVRSGFFERFAEDRAEFEKQQGLDPSRPRAERPAAWRNLSLGEGKALAKRENRPLLVFFYTESNAWCYRAEFHTFPDREVDDLLRRFVLVRIDAEKDPEGSFQASGARGFPTFLPLARDGRGLAFALKLKDGELRNEKFITGWQRPQEFAENLRRILAAAR